MKKYTPVYCKDFGFSSVHTLQCSS